MKFQWDNSKVILTTSGQQILELYGEYLKASDLVKKAIFNHIRSGYSQHFSRISSWIESGIPLESFENNLKGLKGYTKNDVSSEKYEAAKQYIASKMTDVDYVTCDDKKSKDVIIVRKMIGIKSTTVRKFFFVPDKMSDKEYFIRNIEYIKWFMSNFVYNIVSSLFTQKGSINEETKKILKANNVNINVTPAPTGRYVNIYVDYEINFDDLTSDVLNAIKKDMTLVYNYVFSWTLSPLR